MPHEIIKGTLIMNQMKELAKAHVEKRGCDVSNIRISVWNGDTHETEVVLWDGVKHRTFKDLKSISKYIHNGRRTGD